MNEFNEGHIVEGCDRLHVIQSNIDQFLVDHPAIVRAGCNDKIKKALELLSEAYQEVGALNHAEPKVQKSHRKDPKYFICFAGGDDEVGQIGVVYEWNGEWIRSPEAVEGKSKNPIMKLRKAFTDDEFDVWGDTGMFSGILSDEYGMLEDSDNL
jgi:hypothetical protein